MVWGAGWRRGELLLLMAPYGRFPTTLRGDAPGDAHGQWRRGNSRVTSLKGAYNPNDVHDGCAESQGLDSRHTELWRILAHLRRRFFFLRGSDGG